MGWVCGVGEKRRLTRVNEGFIAWEDMGSDDAVIERRADVDLALPSGNDCNPTVNRMEGIIRGLALG